jgi:predicted 3-demethylubiquinone-9 3-methyltransferase (glyoxalase superfamily)
MANKKIVPFLWFNGQAEAAARFYVSVFKKKSRIVGITPFPEDAPGRPAAVMTVRFRILGTEFVALNGGPEFKFNPAISFVVPCATQKEIDYYWKRLMLGGGKPAQCGWLEDKFGVSWQIVPKDLSRLLDPTHPKRSARVMKALMEMVKIDLKRLRAASKATGK